MNKFFDNDFLWFLMFEKKKVFLGLLIQNLERQHLYVPWTKVICPKYSKH